MAKTNTTVNMTAEVIGGQGDIINHYLYILNEVIKQLKMEDK